MGASPGRFKLIAEMFQYRSPLNRRGEPKADCRGGLHLKEFISNLTFQSVFNELRWVLLFNRRLLIFVVKFVLGEVLCCLDCLLM